MSLQLSGTSGVLDNSGAFVSGTAVATTSGTSIDFTSIPSWVKRITVMFNGTSLSGTSNYLIQIGSGSITSSGYASGGTVTSTTVASATAGTTSTAGFVMYVALAVEIMYGTMVISLVSGNSYISNYSIGGSLHSGNGGGGIALAGVLDRVRITTTNGTDTFDAGSINILYE